MTEEVKVKKPTKKYKIAIVMLVLAVLGAATLLVLYEGDRGAPAADNRPTNPLTGEKVNSLPSRPFILSTDNDTADARPQSGLSKADIVYEVPIEGGASRLEPIYYGNTPDKIGPARSARPYIVDIAREYKAVLVHNGWSPAAQEYLQSDVIPYLPAAYNWGIFWRSDDRFSPHNCYTDGHAVMDLIEEKGMDETQELRGFQFLKKKKNAPALDDKKSAPEVEVNFVTCKNLYRYNQEEGLYYKWVDNLEYTDKETEAQISCSNVIVQYVKYTSVDEKQRLAFDMCSGGDAILFTQGKIVRGTWSRETLDSSTIFKDKDGKEFKLTPGRTWVTIADQTVTVNIKNKSE